MPQNEILQDIQEDISNARSKGVHVGSLSDGYHSYDELYMHRIALFMAVCNAHSNSLTKSVWMSKVQGDGAAVQEGWFILGIGTRAGKQITYHLPLSKWQECTKFASIKNQAPPYDGHTSADVLTRLTEL